MKFLDQAYNLMGITNTCFKNKQNVIKIYP
jgi:hypothetical protein